MKALSQRRWVRRSVDVFEGFVNIVFYLSMLAIVVFATIDMIRGGHR